MKRLLASAKCFCRSEVGATSVEYGLLIGLLSIIAVGTVVSLSKYINGTFYKVQSQMANGGMPTK